ncbi:hypothetical protein [Sphingomonas pruni]|uniref:hypothetical protein n=1 Tax=Sphingomonas pruni TaxID=40683 RepID=UPI00082C015C|nr:hypothetical protein [Sphingomonas pruni]
MDSPDTLATIVGFLRGIGIPVEPATLPDDGFLPAIAVRDGGLLYDADRLQWPGDLLHEAGHIAMADPASRPTVSDVGDDPGDEMAAIAWSYAAALAIGIEPQIVFHDHGYRGEGRSIAENFAQGRYFGVPMLQYYGLARFSHDEGEHYPAMIKWLR